MDSTRSSSTLISAAQVTGILLLLPLLFAGCEGEEPGLEAEIAVQAPIPSGAPARGPLDDVESIPGEDAGPRMAVEPDVETGRPTEPRPEPPPLEPSWQHQAGVLKGEILISDEEAQAAFHEAGIELIFPVANGLAEPAVIDYEVTLAGPDEKQPRRVRGKHEARPGMSSIRAVFEDSDVPRDPKGCAMHAVGYSMKFIDKERKGHKSLAAMLRTPMLVAQAPQKLYAGEKARIPVQVYESRTRRPLAGVDVSLEVADDRAEPLKTSGRTGRDGSALLELELPAGDSVNFTASVAPSTAVASSVRFSAEVLEETKCLLTTDKPLYQPGQTIHIRALVLKKPHMKPLAEEDFLLEVLDSKGNKVFKKAEKTNAYGVGYATFTLANQINMGNYTVVATAGDNRMEKTVEVKRYVLPKFKVEVELKKDSFVPGEEVSGSLTARYFFGKPVAGGRARVTFYDYQGTWVQDAVVEGETNDEGIFPFTHRLPERLIGQPLENGNALVLAEFKVTDTADQTASSNRQLPVIANPISVALFPESGAIVPGIANRFHLLVTNPQGNPLAATCAVNRLTGSSPLPAPLSLDGTGPGVLELTPSRESFEVDLVITAGKDSVTRTFSFSTDQREANVLLRTARPIYRVGETLVAELLAIGTVGQAFLDVTRENQTMATATVDMKQGAGRYQLDLDASLSGALVVSAYLLAENGEFTRDSRVVFVEAPSDLDVEVTTDKQQYRPGRKARLQFSVTDPAGAPVQAALGLQVVDEAVFALSDSNPGLMKLYFALEKELLEPSYQVGSGVGLTFGSLLLRATAAREENERARIMRDAEIALAARGDVKIGKAVLNSFALLQEEMQAQVQKAWDEWLQGVGKRAVEKFSKDNQKPNHCQGLEKAVGAELKEVGRDFWGNELKISEEGNDFRVASAGLDGEFGTPDDLRGRLDFWALCPSLRGKGTGQMFQAEDMGGFGGGGMGGNMRGIGAAPGLAMAKEERRDRIREMVATKSLVGVMGSDFGDGEAGETEAAGEEVRVRSWFPETLFVEPDIITDEQGRADLEVPLADSITTWRMSTVASDARGRLGGHAGGLTVFQDFFVDIDFPVYMTRNDEVEFPVAVYSYLDREQDVQVTLEKGNWFETLGDTAATVHLKPGEVKGLKFPMRVTKVGWHSLTVHARGSAGFADAVERTVDVRADGREVIRHWSANFKRADDGPSTDSFETVLKYPAGTIEGSNHLVVRILPGLSTHVVQGMESMLKLPGG